MTTQTEQEKTMLQQISDVAWLVQQGEMKMGILSKDRQEHYTFISGKELIKFEDDMEVRTHFGNASLFETRITENTSTKDSYYIGGHLVDYPEPFAVDESNPDYRPDVPLYTKIEGSNVYYAAGFYAIQFEKGWKHSNSPKFSTLKKYGFEGPFKTLIDVKQRVKALNKSLAYDAV